VTDPAPDDAVTERIPIVRPERAEPSLGRSSSLMALGSLASRITGFLRQVALFTVLGATVLNDSYTLSNTLPNIVYELLIGGALSSMMIPLLVRAQREDPDGGEAYTRKLITLTGAALLVATAAGLLTAPLLTQLYLGGETTSKADPALATTLAYMLLPQIFFYGLGALLGAVLNSRGSFGAFGWAPVLNNVVVLTVVGVYLAVPDDVRLLVLGVGTTLGIAAQTLVLLPAARRVGFRYRPLWGWDPRLTKAASLGAWAIVYVLIGQAGLIVTSRVATGSDGGAFAIYTNAWLLLQVPYGVLGVSLLTVLMPRMSRAAAEGRTADVAADLGLGGKLASVLLVPISVLLTVFGTAVGAALAVSAFGLLPFAFTMLQARVLYALTAHRWATFVQLCVVATKIPLMLACPALLAPEDVVLGLAAANSTAFVVGAVVGQLLLRRMLGRVPTAAVLGTAGRSLVAAAAGMLLAAGVVALLAQGPLATLAPLARAWAELGVAVVLGGPVTVLLMRLIGIDEVGVVLKRLERLVDKGKPRRGTRR
jgi:putative peptidoglycan lipid II flippase